MMARVRGVIAASSLRGVDVARVGLDVDEHRHRAESAIISAVART